MTLTIAQVSKQYRDVKVLDEISLTFEIGHIYGLLGRNGAGKSTLLNIINNRIFATSGTVVLDGQKVSDNEKALNHIFLMSEDNLYPDDLNILKLFKLTEHFYGSFDYEFAAHLVRAFKINTKTKFKKLSTGYRSIAKLIIALCVPADYIFLDEPVLGLDASHRDVFYKYLLDTFMKRPRAFIISTHLIEEITTIADEIVIIDQGAIMQSATTEQIKRSGVRVVGPEASVLAFTKEMTVMDQETLGGLTTIYVQNYPKNSIVPEDLTVSPLTLQDYFIHMTSKAGESNEI
ncbi:ATP-binding cassette domain-containing protein [Agrilactobacillus yilanensis]|uniref:ATP-binding cassette domain-containing protein n=1 Tax=Agrilactobacillus yilanensis TaxID=2485997 RepID=A0ABW4J4K5_9LACO|nr:ABC transporter ATP-binding protein [Agrilactobacillus yilanensis]